MSHSSQPLSLFEQTELEHEEKFYRTFPEARIAAQTQAANQWYQVQLPDHHYFPGTSFLYGPSAASSSLDYHPEFDESLNQNTHPPSTSSLEHAVTDPSIAPPHLQQYHADRSPQSTEPHPAVASTQLDAAAYQPPDPVYGQTKYNHPNPPHTTSHPQVLPTSHPSSVPSPSHTQPSFQSDSRPNYVPYSSNEPPMAYLPADSASPTSFAYTEPPPTHPDLAFSQPSFDLRPSDHWPSSSSPSPFSESDFSPDFVKSESPEPLRPTSSSVPRPTMSNVHPRTARWPPRSQSPPPVRIPVMAGTRRTLDKKPPLACLFCRQRKIACGPPLPGSKDKTCNQCQRRSLKCEYPLESRRGMRKKKDVTDNITTEGPKVVIAKSKH